MESSVGSVERVGGKKSGKLYKGPFLQAKELRLSPETRGVWEVCKPGSGLMRLAFVLK